MQCFAFCCGLVFEKTSVTTHWSYFNRITSPHWLLKIYLIFIAFRRNNQLCLLWDVIKNNFFLKEEKENKRYKKFLQPWEGKESSSATVGKYNEGWYVWCAFQIFPCILHNRAYWVVHRAWCRNSIIISSRSKNLVC